MPKIVCMRVFPSLVVYPVEETSGQSQILFGSCYLKCLSTHRLCYFKRLHISVASLQHCQVPCYHNKNMNIYRSEYIFIFIYIYVLMDNSFLAASNVTQSWAPSKVVMETLDKHREQDSRAIR